MKKQAFVIGDIHGMNQELKEILTYWQPSQEELVFLGDYIDRGPNSRETLNTVHKLNTKLKAHTLRGNHEQMLLDFLNNPQEKWPLYFANHGTTTLSQLLKINEEAVFSQRAASYVDQINRYYPHLRDWLDGLPYYYEFGDFVCVHAGLDLSLDNWLQTSQRDFLWIRDNFLEASNQTGRQIIFGHTPTLLLHNQAGIWQDDGKIGIDGGAVYGERLIGLKISQDEILDVIEIQAKDKGDK